MAAPASLAPSALPSEVAGERPCSVGEGLNLALRELGRFWVGASYQIEEDPDAPERCFRVGGDCYRGPTDAFRDEVLALDWALVVATLARGVRA
jgi:hypothetical protein